MDLEDLTGQLRAGPVRERVRAARQLGKMSTLEQTAVKALVRAVKTDENEKVRVAAVKSLGNLKATEMIRPVAEALVQNQLDFDVTVKTLQAFGDQSFRPLVTTYRNTPYPYALIRAGEGISEQQLLRALRWKDPNARAYAAILLGNRASITALPRLAELLKDASEHVRSAAAEAIARIENETPSLEGSILPAQLRSSDWRVRQTVLRVLSDRDPDLAWPVVRASVTDSDFRVRTAAAAAIDRLISTEPAYQLRFTEETWGQAEEDQLVATLAGHLHQPTTPDNYTTAAALVGLRSPETAREIVRCLDGEDVQLRAAMAEAIRDGIRETNTNQPGGWLQVGQRADGRLHIAPQTRTIVQKLTRAARDTHAGVRVAAVAALENMKEKIDEAESGYAPLVQPGTKSVAHPEQVVEVIDKALQEATPVAVRYANASFYDGGKQERHQMPNTAPLVKDTWYFLEVAVQTRESGIPVRNGKKRAVREPRQKGPVKLLVVLEAAGFDLPNAVQELTLPPKGDSTENAWFEVRPQRSSTGLHDLAKIRVRVFYQLNLIEVFTIEAEVVGELDDPATSRFGMRHPKGLNQEALPLEYTDFDEVVARSMHIEVRRPGTDYELTFTVNAHSGPALALTATTRLKFTDLEDILEQFRRKFEALANSKTYLQGVKGKTGTFQNAVHDLAKMGRGLWTNLFNAKPGSALDVIGQRLQRQPLPNGAMIQVSVQEEASDFLVPWSMLYDRTVPDAAYQTDVHGFWGLRYPIEQRVVNIRVETDAPREVDGALKMLFMLWEDFRNAQSQLTMMDSLKERAGDRLDISNPPVTSKLAFYETAGSEAHILYFYTHGHTRRRLDNTDPMIDLKKWADTRYPYLSKEAQALQKSLYEAVITGHYEGDSSWIELSHGTLYLAEMRERIRFFPGRPLVILNMCESVQVTPTLADSFVDFFLDRKACAVIGTECPMTVEFAHPFAERFFEGILAGRSVGDVLVEARRYFMLHEKNPLGLAYTLFGSAAATFVPPRLPDTIHEHKTTEDKDE